MFGRVVKKFVHLLIDFFGEGPVEKHLLRACREGDRDLVNAIIAFGVNLSHTDLNGFNCLHFAAREGHRRVVRILIARERMSLTALTSDEYSPLLLAVAHNHLHVMQEILTHAHAHDNAALLNQRESVLGFTALHFAANQNSVEIMRRLLPFASSFSPFPALNVNMQSKDGSTALNIASAKGHTAIVKLLITYKADVDIVDERGDSPLMTATRANHTDVVRILLARFTNHSLAHAAANAEGMSPLHIAAVQGHTEALSLLLENDLLREKMLNARDSLLSTPLVTATQFSHAEYVRKLLQQGADPLLPDINGDNALIIASRNGDTELTSILLQTLQRNETLLQNALHQTNDCGYNALLAALQSSSNSTLDNLLPFFNNSPCESFALSLSSMRLPSEFKQHNTLETPLTAERDSACFLTLPDMNRVAMWLQWLSDHTQCLDKVVNKGNKRGETLLYRAARDGEAPLVSLLLSFGADPSICDAIDVRPEAIASLNTHTELALTLRKARLARESMRYAGIFASNSTSAPGGADGSRAMFEEYRSSLWPSLARTYSAFDESDERHHTDSCAFGRKSEVAMEGNNFLAMDQQPIHTVLSVGIVVCSVLLNLLLLRILVRGWKKMRHFSDTNRS